MKQSQKDFWAKEHDFRRYGHPIVNYFSTQRIGFIKKFVKTGEVNNLLDVGAGEGFSSFYLQKICHNIVATDFSEKMLFKNPITKKVLADAHSLPFKDNSFDMVCAWEVFHHLDNVETAVKEIIRVSSKYICVFEVNRDNPVQFAYALVNKAHRGAIKFSSGYLLSLFKEDTRIIEHATTGVIFPNKTPMAIFPILKKVPFIVPLIGISNFIICEKI